MPITRRALLHLLDALDDQFGRGQQVELSTRDSRVLWHELEGDASELPSLPYGQSLDVRHSLEDGRSMHIHVFEDRIRVHVDQVDPKRAPVRHVLVDTWAPRGAVLGGLGVGLATRHPLGILAGALAGGLLGVGAQVSRPKVWHVSRVRADGTLEARRAELEFEAAQQLAAAK